jgi:hypothetical protein
VLQSTVDRSLPGQLCEVGEEAEELLRPDGLPGGEAWHQEDRPAAPVPRARQQRQPGLQLGQQVPGQVLYSLPANTAILQYGNTAIL